MPDVVRLHRIDLNNPFEPVNAVVIADLHLPDRLWRGASQSFVAGVNRRHRAARTSSRCGDGEWHVIQYDAQHRPGPRWSDHRRRGCSVCLCDKFAELCSADTSADILAKTKDHLRATA